MQVVDLMKTDASRKGIDQRVRDRIRLRYPIFGAGMHDGSVKSGRIVGLLAEHALGIVRAGVDGFGAMRAQYNPEQLRNIIEPIDLLEPIHPGEHTRLTVVELSSKLVYACWNLPRIRLEEARLRMGEGAVHAALSLRFEDVTPGQGGDGFNGGHQFDIDVAYEEDARYIELWSAGRRYSVTLGIRSEDGRFIALGKSSIRPELPRENPGDAVASFINVIENTRPVIRPRVPDIFRTKPVMPDISDSAFDWPTRDVDGEGRIVAVYRDFLSYGPTVLRNAQPLRRPELSELRKAYELREARRSAGLVIGKKPESNFKSAIKPDIVAIRVDGDSKPHKPAVSKTARPLSVRSNRASLQDLGREQRAREISELLKLTRMGAKPRIGGRNSLPAPKVENETPTRIKVKKPVRINQLSSFIDALSAAGVELEAELTLRGKVPAGKKVRIGGQVIDTDREGRFCVTCVVKDGRLHVPVEVVEAEVVTARTNVSVDLGMPQIPRN